MERIKTEVPGLKINTWYLDDGTLCGSPADLAAALSIVEQDGPTRGLYLNRSKSLLYIPDDAHPSNNPLPPVIPTTRVGFTLLGCPIGPSTFCDFTFSKRVEKVKESLARLPDLQDSQMETALLRSCLALPKVSFSLRACQPDHIRQGTALWDDTIRDALTDLAGSPLPDWAWLRASLPSSLGGLNIRRASLHAPAAYISSIAQSRGLVEKNVIIPPPTIWLAPSHPWPMLQNAQTGHPWRRSTPPSVSAPSPTVLMRQSTINFYQQPLTPDPGPSSSPPPSCRGLAECGPILNARSSPPRQRVQVVPTVLAGSANFK